ncbi:unnamed protein product [Durusdinium trenchii]|uniref:Uncharacterized protein n=2 Tax=Durusdinium trenchii TaxID=1381693 RepID=A0ABP0IUG5_9DINO
MVCCDKVVIFALLAKAVAMVEIQSTVWVKSAGGQSCEVACKARGGCKEDDWPTTEQEFQEMLQESGYSCVGIQVGGAKYDPSTDGRYCGWKGDAESSRCSTVGDSGTYRFCPCYGDKEL